MKNIGLTRCISAKAENFTTDRGIQLRRRIARCCAAACGLRSSTGLLWSNVLYWSQEHLCDE